MCTEGFEEFKEESRLLFLNDFSSCCGKWIVGAVRTEINKMDYLGNLCRSPGLDCGGRSAYILEVE